MENKFKESIETIFKRIDDKDHLVTDIILVSNKIKLNFSIFLPLILGIAQKM